MYAELGSTWRAVMADLDQAAHVLGKLLLAVGEDNIVWGTDSIWYGSPQDQIAAFRAFQITPEFQERFGYPGLTAERKAKILGLNALRVFGIEQPVRPRALRRARLRPRRGSAGEPVARPRVTTRHPRHLRARPPVGGRVRRRGVPQPGASAPGGIWTMSPTSSGCARQSCQELKLAMIAGSTP